MSTETDQPIHIRPSKGRREVAESGNTIVVNAKVEMTAASLQAIVANSKRLTTPDAKGHYHVDTADKVSEMISRFLLETDFESFVQDIENYRSTG